MIALTSLELSEGRADVRAVHSARGHPPPEDQTRDPSSILPQAAGNPKRLALPDCMARLPCPWFPVEFGKWGSLAGNQTDSLPAFRSPLSKITPSWHLLLLQAWDSKSFLLLLVLGLSPCLADSPNPVHNSGSGPFTKFSSVELFV